MSRCRHWASSSRLRWVTGSGDCRGINSRTSCCVHLTYVPAQRRDWILEGAGISADSHILHSDERLREKEFGILDRLTTFGIRERHPELSAQRSHVGKFYFRPPGGESWCDVILRLRSVIDTMTREYRRERVLIVAHQVIVNCFRYLLERMNEAQILELDRIADVPNCAVMHLGPLAGRRIWLAARCRRCRTSPTAGRGPDGARYSASDARSAGVRCG